MNYEERIILLLIAAVIVLIGKIVWDWLSNLKSPDYKSEIEILLKKVDTMENAHKDLISVTRCNERHSDIKDDISNLKSDFRIMTKHINDIKISVGIIASHIKGLHADKQINK